MTIFLWIVAAIFYLFFAGLLGGFLWFRVMEGKMARDDFPLHAVGGIFWPITALILFCIWVAKLGIWWFHPDQKEKKQKPIKQLPPGINTQSDYHFWKEQCNNWERNLRITDRT